MSKQKFFMLLLNLLSLSASFAQKNSEQLLTVVPPSPTVASLGKYGEVPVSLYTGVPNISIPLYEIKDGSLDLPITLSYHAGGIKVEEMASPVGLSWTLNAGGVVGRNVRGLPDQINPGQPVAPAFDIERIMLSGSVNQIQQLVKDVDKGDRDGETDIFYYNFDQLSGKFFYDQKGVVHTLPAKNLLIHPVTGGWKITSEDGTVYTFTKVEEVRSATCSGDYSIESAWFLTKIKSLDGKREINFSYEQVNYTYETLIGQTKYFSVNSAGNTCLKNQSPCLGTQNYNTQRLVRIDFTEGYINFKYNTLRCDLMNDKSLDEVKVYNKSNQLIKGFKFGYSYFGNNSDGCNYLTKNLKRLKLISLTEENTTSQKPPYIFKYNESVELPGRLSYAQDHWGYYNGKLNNPDLIATFTTTVFSGAQVVFEGANRDANTETAQAGILTKIKYPTGGETSFTYESNTVSDELVKPQVKTREELIVFGVSDVVSDLPVSQLPIPYESNEIVVPSQGAQVQFNISGLSSTLWPGCDIVQCMVIKDNKPFGQLADSWNGVKATWTAGTYKLRLISDCNIEAKAKFSITVSAQIPIATSDVLLIAGGLRIKMIEDKPGNQGPSVVKNYRYHLENDRQLSSGVLVNFPEYGYDLSVHSTYKDEHGSSYGPLNYCFYRVRQSFSNYPLATTQGSYVGYSNVIVDLGENGESWYSFEVHPDVKSVFPFAPIESSDWSRGFLLSTKDFIRRNNDLVLAREVINSPLSFNQTRIYGIKTGRNNYNIDGGEMLPFIQSLPQYTFYPTITEFFALGKTKEKTYDQHDPTKFVETITEYTYSPQHLQSIQSKTVTSRSDETTTEEIITNKKYPFDYTFSSAPSGVEASGIKNLQDLHVVNAVIEEYVLKQNRNSISNQLSDQRVVDGGITIFKSDKPYPDQFLRLEIGSPVPLSDFGNGSLLNANTFIKNTNAGINNSFNPAVIFNSYDDKGNITTQQKAGDVLKSYIWGYNSRYPVAEVVGVDYETIIASADLNQSVLQSLSTGDEEMRTELNKVRTKFPSALVTTYTFKPLVGISSQTDINNRSTYYEYDSFGRLVLIRDQDKNILKKLCYNYQGQEANCAINMFAH